MRALTALLVLSLAAGALTGCASAPIQEMSDARQALQAARQADASTHAPAFLERAEVLLAQAEGQLKAGSYRPAAVRARAAKERAIQGRRIALALGEAQGAMAAARSHGSLWAATERLLGEAQAAERDLDAPKAARLAGHARAQAEEALRDFFKAEAGRLIAEAEGYREALSVEHLTALRDARAALEDGDARRAFELVEPVVQAGRRALTPDVDGAAGTQSGARQATAGRDGGGGVSGSGP